MTHICISKLTIICSNNGFLPGRRQAIIWTNAGISSIGPLGTNFNEILIKIHTFSFKKIHLKMSSRKWQPFCLGLNVLNRWTHEDTHVHSKEYDIKTCPWFYFALFHAAYIDNRDPQIAKFMGPTWVHLGPVGPRWAPCWPHEPCYQGSCHEEKLSSLVIMTTSSADSNHNMSIMMTLSQTVVSLDNQVSGTPPLTIISALPWTKWPPFHRQYFQMHFHEWKLLYFNWNFTQGCS